MATKSYEEKLAELERKEAQLKAQKKALKAKHADKERKARTKRLIEIGAAVESVLKHEILQEDLPEFIRILSDIESKDCYLSRAMHYKK